MVVFRAMTESGKTFRQLSPNSTGFVFKAPPKPWPLYNRSRIQNADTVVVCEGEKCVHALHDYSVVATTSPCGAGKAQHADWTPLAGKNIILWPDNDEAGRKHMADVENLLQQVEPAPRISILEPTELDLDEKEDATDFIQQLEAAGHNKAEIQAELQEVLSKAKPRGVAARVAERIEGAISGKVRAIEFPWSFLRRCSKALSGTKELADRKGLATLLDMLESNGLNLVLVECADRLARDLVVGEVILGQFRDLGVKVVATNSGTDLTACDDDPTRVLIRQVLGAVSQFDKSVTVLKLRAARGRVRRRNGRCEGRKPYGTRPGEQRVVQRILDLRRKPRGERRLSVAKIAEILNRESLPTRTGRPWQPGTVWAILSRIRKSRTS